MAGQTVEGTTDAGIDPRMDYNVVACALERTKNKAGQRAKMYVGLWTVGPLQPSKTLRTFNILIIRCGAKFSLLMFQATI